MSAEAGAVHRVRQSILLPSARRSVQLETTSTGSPGRDRVPPGRCGGRFQAPAPVRSTHHCGSDPTPPPPVGKTSLNCMTFAQARVQRTPPWDEEGGPVHPRGLAPVAGQALEGPAVVALPPRLGSADRSLLVELGVLSPRRDLRARHPEADEAMPGARGHTVPGRGPDHGDLPRAELRAPPPGPAAEPRAREPSGLRRRRGAWSAAGSATRVKRRTSRPSTPQGCPVCARSSPLQLPAVYPASST